MATDVTGSVRCSSRTTAGSARSGKVSMAETSVRRELTKRKASLPGAIVATARARPACAVQVKVSNPSTLCTPSQRGAQIAVSTSSAVAPL